MADDFNRRRQTLRQWEEIETLGQDRQMDFLRCALLSLPDDDPRRGRILAVVENVRTMANGGLAGRVDGDCRRVL